MPKFQEKKALKTKSYIREFIPKIARYRLARLGLFPPGTPMNLTFSVTNACQSHCRTCSIWKAYRDNPTKYKEELDLSEIEAIFKSTGHIAVFNVSGGEPFLRPDLVEIIELALKYLTPSIIHIPTNAIAENRVVKMTHRIVDLLKRDAEGVQLTVKPSLDHIGDKHDAIRGAPGNFKKVIRVFQRLQELKKDYERLHVELGTVISTWNIGDIAEICHFVTSLGPDSYRHEIAEIRSEMFNANDPITPGPKEYRKAVEDYVTAVEGKVGKEGLARFTQAFRLVYYDIALKVLEEKRQVIPCYAGISNAHLSPYGDVWACCVLGYDRSMGNLRDFHLNFKALWNSKKAKEMRKYIREGNCCCPLANQAYSNILLHGPSLFRVISKIGGLGL